MQNKDDFVTRLEVKQLKKDCITKLECHEGKEKTRQDMRKEFQDKLVGLQTTIDNMNDKLDSFAKDKVSNKVFYTFVFILVTVLGSMLTFIVQSNNAIIEIKTILSISEITK